jgi:hypothetical protein
MSPDWSAKEDPVPYAKLDDPQSLNLYGYVGNNPLGRADADGHCCSWDQIKTGLDVVGFVPVVGDVANAASGAISLAQGHYGEAALSFASAVPIVGALGEIGKGAELLKDAGILANRTKGLAGEVKVGEELVAEGTKVLGSHVGVQTEEGLRVVDHLVEKEGKLGAVEVKTGEATRTASQVAKDESMADKGGKIVGKNAPEALRGQTVKLPTEVRKPQP